MHRDERRNASYTQQTTTNNNNMIVVNRQKSFLSWLGGCACLWLFLVFNGDGNDVVMQEPVVGGGGGDSENISPTTTTTTRSSTQLVYSFTPISCSHFQSIMPNDNNNNNYSEQSSTTTSTTTTTTMTTASLVRNPNTTTCHRALGVESISISSSNHSSNKDDSSSANNTNTNNIDTVVTTTNSNNNNNYYITSNATSKELFRTIRNANQGISFALWIKPDASSFDNDGQQQQQSSSSRQRRPILTIGRRHRRRQQQQQQGSSQTTTTRMGGLNECDDDGLDFQLAQRNDSLEIVYRTSESIFEPCQYYRLVDYNLDHNNPINTTATVAPPKTTTTTVGEQQQQQQRNLSSSSSSSSSSSLLLPVLVPGKLIHVVVSLADENQQVFINGHAVVVVAASSPALSLLTRPFWNNLSHWHIEDDDDDDEEDYGLHLFAFNNNNLQQEQPEQQHNDNNNATVWRGAIYQLTIDIGNQSALTVQTLLLAGLPPSEPFATNFTTQIHEDAEAVAGSNPPEWYRNQAQVVAVKEETNITISRIPLLFESMDQQVHDLLLENGIIVVNTNGSGTTTLINGPTFLTYVTKLPEVGSLYLTDGTKLEANIDGMTNLVFPVLSNQQVFYIPPLNAYSNKTATMGLLDVFASFDFCVSKKPIISAQQCTSATIRIVVKPVNDPPIAWTGNYNNFNAIIVVPEGIERLSTPKIYLGGTDVDVDDYINQVQVTQPPLYGRLILSVGSFRQDRIRHGTDVTDDLENIIRGRDPVYVKYIFEPLSFPGAVQGSSAKDSFRFRVADQHYRWSAEETVHIQISSAIQVVNHNVHVVSEDSQQQGNAILSAKDGSGYTNRRLGFYIESTPLAISQGVLVDPATNVSLQVGSILSTSSGATIDVSNVTEEHELLVAIPITFIPAPNYCTTSHSKQKNNLVQFQIRAVAFDGHVGSGDDNHIASVSDPVTQFVQVECVMDDLSMNVPLNSDKTYRLLQSTLRRFPEDSCRGAIFDPLLMLILTNTTTTADLTTKCPRAAIFQGITVTSKDLHQQLVHVSVQAGEAGFLTFNKHFWNLTRPIHGRRAMSAGLTSFYALPLDLTYIFSHLHFQSYRVGVDQVDIVLLYGNCTHRILQSETLMAMGSADDAVSKLSTSNATSTSTCQVLRHSIRVFVERDEKADHYTTSLVPSFPWQLFVCLLLYPTIYYIFVQIDRFWCRASMAEENDNDDDTTMMVSPEDDNDANSNNNNNNNNNNALNDNEWPDWIQHKTADGEFYYENTNDGSVTWMAPIGQQFVPYKEEENEEEKDEII